jgi:hypothetical protein
MAVGAAAHFQVDLHTTNPRAFDVYTQEMKRIEYDNHPFIGAVPWYPYSVSVDVGTPAQRQSMAITLSHGDSWILYSELCTPVTNPNYTEYSRNCSSGAFGEIESTTFRFNETDDFISHYSDEWVDGMMMQDTVTLGDATLEHASLGIALQTRLDTGFFGLGTPWASPVTYTFEERAPMLDNLAAQGIINSPAFSMHAEKKDNTTGSLLFGAVDKSKFEGKLQRIQASAARDKFARESHVEGRLDMSTNYVANVSAVWRAEKPGDEPVEYVSDDGGPFYASIDPTFAITNVPEYVAKPIWWAIRPYIWHNIQMRTVPCDREDLNVTMAFELGGEGGYKLNVTLQDLIVPPEVWHLVRPRQEDDDEDEPEFTKHCLLGIQSTEQNRMFHLESYDSPTEWVIGGMLLQKTYTVFDSVNMEVSFAKLKSDLSRKADVVAFESLGAHAPESDFVGTEECFKDCPVEKEEDDEDAGPHVVVERGLALASVLIALGFVLLS